MNNWINTYHKKPEKNKYVLVCWSEYYTSLDWDIDWGWTEDWSRIAIAKLKKNGKWIDENGEKIVKPSHWQLLPILPKD
ncbi:Domain of unknown function DUF551 [uncultured Caudovirales phage]|uniref:DUF551 domain-containing protein n=1 Tax=uncultured Caudovirales phage TaxID=2100421 RepID=A0A6J5KKY5_9CAUD|nr:Domain of unknown function DUF551 [uncultured Caudovirales phage]